MIILFGLLLPFCLSSVLGSLAAATLVVPACPVSLDGVVYLFVCLSLKALSAFLFALLLTALFAFLFALSSMVLFDC